MRTRQRSHKITPAEAEAELKAHYEKIDHGWEVAHKIAVGIAEAQGFENPVIELPVWERDGEASGISVDDGFYVRVDGELIEVERPSWQEASQEEKAPWIDLMAAVNAVAGNLPPQLGVDTAASPKDLYGDDEVTRMVMFAHYDGDGNFQYDDKGIMTVIEGVWY